MKTYTVLLLRPDYIADNYGEDTYMTFVEADNVRTAQTIAQAEAMWADHEEDGTSDPADYLVLLVIEGQHNDIKTS